MTMTLKRNAFPLALAAMALFTSCAAPKTITITQTTTQTVTGSTVTATIAPPLATSEGRIADGFQFTVTVSNVRPRLGESVTIGAELLNLFNATYPVDLFFGQIVLQIADDRGNIVWRASDKRDPVPTTTPAPPLGTGFSWSFTRSWTAGGNYTVPTAGTYTPVLPLTAGIYTLSASTTLFGLAVTPIQITVSA